MLPRKLLTNYFTLLSPTLLLLYLVAALPPPYYFFTLLPRCLSITSALPGGSVDQSLTAVLPGCCVDSLVTYLPGCRVDSSLAAVDNSLEKLVEGIL